MKAAYGCFSYCYSYTQNLMILRPFLVNPIRLKWDAKLVKYMHKLWRLSSKTKTNFALLKNVYQSEGTRILKMVSKKMAS